MNAGLTGNNPPIYAESDLIPLSALQHLLYCERQWALIHLERVWRENRLTAEGRRLHKNAHEGGPKSRDGERVTRGLEVRSFTHGLFGVCDIVLWKPPVDMPRSLSLPEAWRRADPDERKRWTVTPVEYKRGRPKKDDCDRAQLCGQALCLEEMLDVSIPAGQIFYGQTRRRVDVEFDDRLRSVTQAAAARLHELTRLRQTPRPIFNKRKCDRCSLRADCLPELPGRRRSASDWLERQLLMSKEE